MNAKQSVTGLEDIKVVMVQGMNDQTALTSHISVGDVLVAVNGKCLASLPPTCSIQRWQNIYMTSEYPRIITFFHFDDNGSFSLAIDKVVVCDAPEM